MALVSLGEHRCSTEGYGKFGHPIVPVVAKNYCNLALIDQRRSMFFMVNSYVSSVKLHFRSYILCLS